MLHGLVFSICSVSALFACATVTPYQPLGFSGGYSDVSLGVGRHQITIEGNGHTPQSTLVRHFHRRAESLCGGGYDTEIQNTNTTHQQIGRYTTVNRHSVTGIVACAREGHSAHTAATL